MSPSNNGFSEPMEKGRKFQFCIGKLHEGECYWREMGVVRKATPDVDKGLSNEGLGDPVRVTSDGAVAVYVERLR